MENNTNLIRDFLWESYLIEEGKDFLKKKEKADDEELKILFKEDHLRNMFLFRIKIDPGLNYYVSKEVKKNKDLQLKVSHKILSLFGKLSKYEYIPSDLLIPNGMGAFVAQKLGNKANHVFEDIDIFNHEFKEFDKSREDKLQKAKIEYFKFRLNSNQDVPDREYEIKVINRYIHEYTCGKYLGNIHAKDTSLSIGKEEVMRKKMQGFISRKIKNTNFYYNNYNQSPIYHELIPAFLPIELDMERLFFGFSALDINSSVAGGIASLWKFEADLYTILDLEWFKELSSIDERIKVLNTEYPFKLTEDILKELPTPTGIITKEFIKLQFYPHFLRLYNLGYYDGAAVVANYIYEYGPDNTKAEMADNIACCYREMSQYQEAKKWYSKAYKEHRKNQDTYHSYVERKNSIEMEYYINGRDYYSSAMDSLYEDAKKISNKISYPISRNIAISCRRVREYDLESKYLTRCLKDLDVNHPEIFQESLEILARLNELNSDMSYNYDNLRKEDDQEDCYKVIWNCLYLVYSFQYSQALNKFKELQRNKSISKYLSTYLKESIPRPIIGHFMYLSGKYEDALRSVSEEINSRKKNEIHSFFYLLRALCNAMVNNEINEDVKKDIENCINNIQGNKLNTFSDVCKADDSNISFAKGMTFELFYLVGGRNSPDIIEEFIEYYIKCLKSNGIVKIPEYLLGYVAYENGLLTEAKGWYEKAISSDEHVTENAILELFNVCMDDDDLDAAQSYLKKALKLKEGHLIEIFVKFADLNIRKENYNDAKEWIRKAKDTYDMNKIDDKNLLKTISDYDDYIELLRSENMPNSDEFSDTVNKFFDTANFLWFDFFKNRNGNEDDELDLSPIIVEYSKGIETYLHENLFLHVRNTMISDGDFSVNGVICQDIRRNLSKSLLLFGEKERTISLGQIDGLYRDIKNLGKVEYPYKEICEKFSNKLKSVLNDFGITYKFIENLGDYCTFLASIRNGTAHYEACNKDELIDRRRDIIKNIHNIVDLVKKIKQTKSI